MPKQTRRGTRHAYDPDYAVPPGRTLQDTIEEMGVDQRELAKRSGISVKHVNQIIKGVATITQETAIRLDRVTGVPARMWNQLEANYREQLARIEEKKRLQSDLGWLRGIPTRELIIRGAIEQQDDRVGLLEEALRFFGVASVDAWKEGWQRPQFAFRKSPSVQDKRGAIATWLRLCERKAWEIPCRPFDKPRFRAALKQIRLLSTEPPDVFVNEMVKQSTEAGVVVVLEPELPAASISGAAKWLTPTRAMIGLNLRGRSNDRFWFTFFHEAGHILNDSKKETYIDIDYADDPREQRANEFAANTLIPPALAGDLQRLRSHADVEQFAESIGIAPGIVVGRLQREKIVPYSHLNKLKVRLEWTPA